MAKNNLFVKHFPVSILDLVKDAKQSKKIDPYVITGYYEFYDNTTPILFNTPYLPGIIDTKSKLITAMLLPLNNHQQKQIKSITWNFFIPDREQDIKTFPDWLQKMEPVIYFFEGLAI